MLAYLQRMHCNSGYSSRSDYRYDCNSTVQDYSENFHVANPRSIPSTKETLSNLTTHRFHQAAMEYGVEWNIIWIPMEQRSQSSTPSSGLRTESLIQGVKNGCRDIQVPEEHHWGSLVKLTAKLRIWKKTREKKKLILSDHRTETERKMDRVVQSQKFSRRDCSLKCF